MTWNLVKLRDNFTTLYLFQDLEHNIVASSV